MADYKDFWVVMGTAAPVVALALAVGIGDTARQGNPQRAPTLAFTGFAMCITAFVLCALVLGFDLPDAVASRVIAIAARIVASFIVVFHLIANGFIAAKPDKRQRLRFKKR